MSNRFSKRGGILTTKHTKEDLNRNAWTQGGEMTKDQTIMTNETQSPKLECAVAGGRFGHLII